MKFWQTIQFKVIFSLCVIFIIVISITTTINYNFARNELIKTLKRSSFHLNESIKSSLEIAMLSGKRSDIQKRVEKIAADKHVLELFITDKSGEIRVSSQKNRIGTKLDIKDEMCQFCHLENHVEQSSNVIYRDKTGKRVLRTVTSITNKKSCQICHPRDYPIVGVLFLDYSLSPYEQEFKNYSRKIALSGMALILSLSLMTIIVLNRFVIRKIRRLVRRIKSIGKAEFSGNFLVKSNDEFGLLARSIDKMGTELQKSFEQLKENKLYFQKIINSIHDGLLVVDRDFRVVLINDLLLEQCGKKEQEILGRKCYETLGQYICGYPAGECECPSKEVFQTGKYCQKKIKLTDNGQEKYHEIFASPLFPGFLRDGIFDFFSSFNLCIYYLYLSNAEFDLYYNF